MGRYLLRRILTAFPTLLIISFVLYAVISLSPGDPLADLALNPNVPPEVRERVRQSLGLDKPWYERYFSCSVTPQIGCRGWVIGLFRGDWGVSFASRIPVWDLIWQRLPNTLWVVGLAYLLAVMIAIPLGVISAVKQYSIFDQLATTLAFIGFSIPTFFTGLLFILIFSVNLRWFPFIYDSTIQVRSWETLLMQVRQIALPVLVLTLFNTATITRFMRASMLDNLQHDYVRTARAKGLKEQAVVLRHVVRNSMIPVVTLIALGVPAVFAGAIITEQIFRVPGIGELQIRSILNSDTPVVMAITFTFSILVVFFNVVADVIYGFLDPRIRYD